MPKFRNPLHATIDYLLGDDEQDIPALPVGLSGDIAQVVEAHLRMLVEFQNTDYALLYLDRLGRFHDRHVIDDGAFRQIVDLLAARMSFNDPIRVAQIVLGRAPNGPSPVALNLSDGLYRPEVLEVAAILPVKLAIKLRNGLDRIRIRGRFRIRPAKLNGRIKLRLLVRFRRLRPKSLRQITEHGAIERWLHMIDRALAKQPEVVQEIIRSAAVVRGWGAPYRLSLLNWHFMIDQLAKPVFDGKHSLPNLPLYLAEAQASLSSDTSGETMRAIVLNARTMIIGAADGAAST